MIDHALLHTLKNLAAPSDSDTRQLSHVSRHNQTTYQSFINDFTNPLTVATSSLTAWTNNLLESTFASLPSTLQSLIRSVTTAATRGSYQLTKPPTQAESPSSLSSLDKFNNLLATPWTATYTSVAATLLAFIFLAYKYSMTSYGRGSFGDYWGGRRSPYDTAPSGRINVTDHDYEYVTGVDPSALDRSYPSDPYRTSVARPYGMTYPDDGEGPDVLLLRHKHQTYELHFQPFAISDGILYLGDVRKYAAEKLNTDPRRLRLLYKGKTLKDDSLPAKAYGLKQQSEIMCVVSEAYMNGAGSDHSGSGEDSSTAKHARPRRAESTTRPRNRAHSTSEPQPPYQQPHPQSHRASIAVPNERRSRDSLHAPASDQRSSSPSRPGHPAPPPHPQTQPNSQQNSPNLAAADANSPLGKLQALASVFHTKWLPSCTSFILSPPSDARARDLEYRKLSESILAQIVLKADDIDTQGDPDARAMRKLLVNEANDVMKRLDSVGKQ